jgi:hypothetical protein
VLGALSVSIEHDDRGSRFKFRIPEDACATCHGSGRMENHALRTVEQCGLVTRYARLGSLLLRVAPEEPDLFLKNAAGSPVSPAGMDRLQRSITTRIGACVAPGTSAASLALRAAWVYGARVALCATSDFSAAANPPGEPEVVFLEHGGNTWDQSAIEALDLWIGWCQRSAAALWISAPALLPAAKDKSGGTDAKPTTNPGWGRVSRQVAARVARARDRHWTESLPPAARSRLAEVCDIRVSF